MNLYSREAAIAYLQKHGREVTDATVAEYLGWLDSWMDAVVDYEKWIPVPLKNKEENNMEPIKMSTTLDDSVVHLDQIAATMEIVLAHIFEHETVNLNGTEEEVAAAVEICKQYGTWRAVLSHVWEALVTERDELAGLSIRATGRVIV